MTKRIVMTSIEDNIWTAIQTERRESIFFSSNFMSYGEAKAVGQSLERLTAKGNIVRLARGIYTYPEIDTAFGLGVLMPSIEQIADTIARRDKARIVPTGIYAMNELGISTQVPMSVVYLTDGVPCKVSQGNGRSIQFKYAIPKNLSFTNPFAMFVTANHLVFKGHLFEDLKGRMEELENMFHT